MNFEEVFASLPSTGWLTRGEASMLWDHAVNPNVGNILEIGTYCGRSAKVLSNAISGNVFRRLYCCDPIIQGFDGVNTPDRESIMTSIAEHVLSGPTALQVHLCCMTEEKLKSLWDNSHRFSLIFIDGDHSFKATLGALERWAPLADKVALHDYGGSHPGVAEAVRAYRFGRPISRVDRLVVFGGM